LHHGIATYRPAVEVSANLNKYKMKAIQDLLNSDANINVTIQRSDLMDFGRFLISQTKTELEAEVIAQQNETYKTRLETCDFLKVDQSTLFRWAKRGYLIPVEVGGKRMYRMSDLQRILNGGRD
jgi:hypothetical protein